MRQSFVCVIAILFSQILVSAGEKSTDYAVGDWSKDVSDSRGYALRGRLVVSERKRGDDFEYPIYVELQDARESVGGTTRVFCDFNAGNTGATGLKCELRDSDNKLVAPTSYPFGGATPASEWVLIPSDGGIRLRSSPFGVFREKAIALTPSIGVLWSIPSGDSADYFLSGTFKVDPDEGRNEVQDPQIWRGTLELPAVRIHSRSN
jgi:hypothetical protein